MNNEELLENKIQQFLKCVNIINEGYGVSSSYIKTESYANETSCNRYITIASCDSVFIIRIRDTNKYLPIMVKDYCEVLLQLFGKCRDNIPTNIVCFELVK